MTPGVGAVLLGPSLRSVWQGREQRDGRIGYPIRPSRSSLVHFSYVIIVGSTNP